MWILRIAHTFSMTNAPYVAKSSLDGKDLVLWDLMVADRDCFFHMHGDFTFSQHTILNQCFWMIIQP